ncbi:calcium-binding protein [Falsiroseomonas bella]|uniref:Calcium-binding protein n=1 Tax=Falsiroseomonas bella TaxID=2184016 RepID=A0A317F7A3_9PROT|nr:calcium-binding protein [Falsiroseomonas bella]PWS34362.1 calcium-binding protein [Falsiroseomonas bella]
MHTNRHQTNPADGRHWDDASPPFAIRVPAAHHEYRLLLDGDEPGRIAGTEARDHVWGQGGDDAIGGGAEDDVIDGGGGNDLLSGNDGMDHLHGGDGADTIYGGAMADMLFGGSGDDVLDEGAGHSGLDGGPGNDTLIGGAGPDAFMVDPESGDDVIRDFTAGPGMFDHLALRDLRWEDLGFEDAATGVRVFWDGGSVLLEGVRMADLAQDDFMFADSPDLPSASRDATAPTGEAPTPSQAGPEIEGDDIATRNIGPGGVTLAVDGGEAMIGRARADELVGGEGNDHVIGRNGDDALAGGGGDDILQGDIGRDTLDGGDGMDRLDGGDGADSLAGGAMADELMGGDGDDVLDEGGGHGMLEGGTGNDTMTGGTGADAFIVTPDSGHDVITDLEVTGLAEGAFDHLALRDIRPDEVSVSDSDEGALVSWDTDGDGTDEGSALLLGVARADLRQSDFMFIEEPGFVAGISADGSDYIFA